VVGGSFVGCGIWFGTAVSHWWQIWGYLGLGLYVDELRLRAIGNRPYMGLLNQFCLLDIGFRDVLRRPLHSSVKS
jgi:hypothetical protein